MQHGQVLQSVVLEPLKIEAGIAIVRSICPGITPNDARVIAGNYDSNPQMLGIITMAVRDRRMSVQVAKEEPNMADMENTDKLIKKVNGVEGFRLTWVLVVKGRVGVWKRYF